LRVVEHGRRGPGRSLGIERQRDLLQVRRQPGLGLDTEEEEQRPVARLAVDKA
jgi:hypothetical protein